MISRNHICVSSPYRDRRQPSAIGLVFLLVAGALAGCSMGDASVLTSSIPAGFRLIAARISSIG